MPAATPLSLRQRVFELHQAGLAAPAIAGRLSLPPRTARHLLARWRRAPEAGLAPGPGRGGRPAAPGLAPAREDCLRLRRERPGWGAGRLRQELLKSYPPRRRRLLPHLAALAAGGRPGRAARRAGRARRRLPGP